MHDRPKDLNLSAWAATALILATPNGVPSILLIRRPENSKDPWSGQFALPGGRFDATDRGLEFTARRETLEEVGLKLLDKELLGPLEVQMSHHRPGAPRVAPWLYLLEETRELQPSSDEVSWCEFRPISEWLRTGADTELSYEYNGKNLRFPGYRLLDGVVWGLTYRTIESLFGRIRNQNTIIF